MAAILLCMVGWVASLVVIANGATSIALCCELCFICVFDIMCFLCALGVYMNDLDLVNWCEVITFCMTL